MGLMNPRQYPIRSATSKEMRVGQVWNTPRFPERGGLTGPSKIDAQGFDLEQPTGRSSSRGNKKAPK